MVWESCLDVLDNIVLIDETFQGSTSAEEDPTHIMLTFFFFFPRTVQGALASKPMGIVPDYPTYVALSSPQRLL